MVICDIQEVRWRTHILVGYETTVYQVQIIPSISQSINQSLTTWSWKTSGCCEQYRLSSQSWSLIFPSLIAAHFTVVGFVLQAFVGTGQATVQEMTRRSLHTPVRMLHLSRYFQYNHISSTSRTARQSGEVIWREVCSEIACLQADDWRPGHLRLVKHNFQRNFIVHSRIHTSNETKRLFKLSFVCLPFWDDVDLSLQTGCTNFANEF